MKLGAFSLVTLLSLLLALSGLCVLGSRMVEEHHDNIIRMKLGGLRDSHHDAVSNHAEIESLARFAIQEHNNKENGLLEFAKVLKAKEQVVAGKIYFLTLEAIDGGKKKLYEAKIWVKPWMNFKQLQEFRQIHAITPFKGSDLGVQQETIKITSGIVFISLQSQRNVKTFREGENHPPKKRHKLGWHEVPTLDPEIIDAASYAVKSIALRSNSLSPYELLEIVLARAKVVEDYVKLNLLLKLRRGMKEERFVVELNKKVGGRFYVSWMKQDSP
ncbi:cysteine proteinase inhibitor 7 isoform X1 [Arachis ipaensis]|uniref:cysteine proteinase inhibitor 7 isoform X1 n=1 Tax=Arachis ipaensis TaxID=130454 RepID=UPI0007AF0006|nr:cysteine proteinase inhibitor 7 isoform X1 [Arachis ipaensis]XP_025658119.1 cysteine proteinase inhibitor 7 isoform X1 [Arachis hypogaea]